MKICECVFCFGSNLSGTHGNGVALTAKHLFGATCGVGIGRSGMSYAIPTKDYHLKVLPLSVINVYVKEFLRYAREHSYTTFLVTKVGCGFAGYKEDDIEPMFHGAPPNCILPQSWCSLNGFSHHAWDNITVADMDKEVC